MKFGCSGTWIATNFGRHCKKPTNDSFPVSSVRGEHSILSLLGHPNTGLLDQYLILLCGSKSSKSADCHAEINWDLFRHWCETKVFPPIAVIGVKSVTVLDRNTYHNILDEQDNRLSTSLNKAD